MARKKKEESVEEEVVELEDAVQSPVLPPQGKSEKERLLELHKTLKDLSINSISDLENLIARAE